MIRVHLIGIGGTGLSAIGKVLLERGYQVSGSDQRLSPLAERLGESGARLYHGHHPENIKGVDLVIRSSAIPDDNVEVMAALDAEIPIFKRADILDRLTEGYQTIAVAGTHGKTTTTAMISWILTALGQDPSYIIGSIAINMNENAHVGRGSTFVIEADEYDHMFLGLVPEIAVVTNVEHDHLDCFPTLHEYHQAFEDFIKRIKPHGILLACGDDPGSAKLLLEVSENTYQTFSYGLGYLRDPFTLDYSGRNLRKSENGDYTFDFYHGSDRLVQLELNVPGVHNVQNGVAAIAINHLMGYPMEEAARALSEFKGTSRRFEIVGESGGIVVVDDYAHHPSEIRNTLAAARTRYPDQRVWAVWQPHTYSRTLALFKDFVTAFQEADCILVTEVYPAREPVNQEFSASQIVEAMDSRNAFFMADLAKAINFLLTELRSGDVLLVLSAGDGNRICQEVLAELSKQELTSV